MNVIVKGMEMPKNCYECPMEGANWCNILEKRVESIDRHQDCPLIEIPPHGRLIDADKLTELCDIMADKCGGIGKNIWGLFRTTVEWSPSIIEEEGSEE